LSLKTGAYYPLIFPNIKQNNKKN